MKDEIKEILSLLNSSSWSNEAKQIEDYITNLQNTNKNHSKKLIELGDKITNLQEENERYKRIFEGKERFSKIMPDDTDFIILSKADYDRQQEDIELGLIDYKSRNEKAIECIKICGINKDTPDNDIVIRKVLKTILNILEGSDKEC